MNKRSSDEIIDEFIREKFGEESFGTWKTLFKVAFIVGRLDVAKFAKDAGVTEDAVRRCFGDDDTDEPEEADDPDTVDEHVSQLEKDADNILDSAGPSPDGLLNQLDALNHQLNILIHIIAVHVKGGC